MEMLERSTAESSEADRICSDYGMSLMALAYPLYEPGDSPVVKIAHYRIGAKDGSWYKEIYPDLQRISCPDKDKQGPFISMQSGRTWSLLDVVKACAVELEKKERKLSGKRGIQLTVDCGDVRYSLLEFARVYSAVTNLNIHTVVRTIAGIIGRLSVEDLHSHVGGTKE